MRAKQIGVELLPRLFGRNILHGAGQGVAGSVDQRGHSTFGVHHSLHEVRHCGRIGDIQGPGPQEALAAGREGFLAGGRHPASTPVDPVATPNQMLGTGLADTRRHAGHDHYLRILMRLRHRSCSPHVVIVGRASGDAAPSTRDPLGVGKGLINRRHRLREPPGSIARDVDVILLPDSELTRQHNGWLVGEAHPRLDRCRIALDQVSPLMPIQADAMAQPVR